WGDELSLAQENVYTDADRMVGIKETMGGKAIAGYALTRDMPLGLTKIEALGSAGSDGQFVGAIELRLSWGRSTDVLIKAETFSSELEIDEEIAGSAFPFDFPFDTDRWFARFEAGASSALRLRAWGLYETNSGEGDVVQGFENRLWVRRAGGGVSVDYKLEPWYRLYLVPRRTGATARGPGLRLRFEYTEVDSDLEMRFNDVRYMHLDGLQGADWIGRLDVMPWSFLSLFGGWERVQLEHHGDSFFDVWPFVIWDVFTARRYRLDDMESTLDTWYVGSAARHESTHILAEVSGRFEWWDSAAQLDWLERVDVLFPFFFRYERHTESSSLDVDYAVQVDAALWWRFSGASLRLAGRATIPLQNDEDPDPAGPGGPPSPGGPPPPPSEDSSHGGLSGTIELVLGR
ncbi:MAG TPA: hypothetical protein VEC56_06995, partial [Candidatus Krumholzibacteria bacterium]|nr:hypothetical protein [Candidatus Krumholzibacteria bacterium]